MKPSSIPTRSLALVTAGALALAVSSCTQYQQQGAAIGALGGAAVGALAGDDTDDVIRGAAIGAAAGTGVAALKEESDRRSGASAPGGDAPPPPPPSPPEVNNRDYPTATPSGTPNLVISPYKPHNVIDVKGFRSGQLAKDPSNDQIFVVP